MRIVVNKKAKRSKVWIYGLFDPRDNALRYVGQTPNPKSRWSAHCGCQGSNPELARWLLELNDAGLKPEMQLFGIVIAFSGDYLIDACLFQGAEHRLIRRAEVWPKTRHTLLNIAGTKKASKRQSDRAAAKRRASA